MVEQHDDRERRRSAATTTFFVVGAIALLAWLLGPLVHVLLLTFAGVLLGLFVHGIGAWMAAHTPLGVTAATAVVCVALAGGSAATMALAAPSVSAQIDELSETLPRAAAELGDELDEHAWGRALTRRIGDLDDDRASREVLSRAGGALSSTLGMAGNLMLFVFVGLFVAFDPGTYRRGILRLVRSGRRPRAGAVLDDVRDTLRMWMVGKIFSMLVVGVLTYVGLALLDVPLALTLTILAALLTFIPNFGPVLAAVPAILLGLVESPATAAWVVALYIGVQTVESYHITPLVQKKTVSLPPALTIVGQLVLGTLAGGLGLIVATPLTAAALVLVKRLYVEEIADRAVG
jgi:predicted PurR-regulated permease PerM